MLEIVISHLLIYACSYPITATFETNPPTFIFTQVLNFPTLSTPLTFANFYSIFTNNLKQH